MKIQCSCGAKYTFEVTPEMLKKPVRFVCSSCGLDASEYVNNLVRQELAQVSTSEGAHDSARASLPEGALSSDQNDVHARSESCAPPAAVAPMSAQAPAVRVVGQASRVSSGRLALAARRTGGTPGESGEMPAPLPDESETCSKHWGVPTTGKCYMCSKPICPKCMELFGYVCSPLCK